MIKVKNILNDLVEHTYSDSDKIEDYKKFFVEITQKTMQSKHGDYNIQTKRIRIFNLDRADDAIIATTIHELAHHIDNMNRGTTDHGVEFYEEYQKLLYKALDMELFSKECYLEAKRDASDSNKVKKMLLEYVPQKEEYKADIKTVAVRNCFAIKEQLKARGYHWNGINKTWEKEVADTEIEQEEQFLAKCDVTYEVLEAKKMTFESNTYIIAGKGSYEIREILKNDGFFYTKDKKWKKKGTADEMKKYQRCYPEVNWKMG